MEGVEIVRERLALDNVVKVSPVAFLHYTHHWITLYVEQLAVSAKILYRLKLSSRILNRHQSNMEFERFPSIISVIKSAFLIRKCR